MTDLNKEYNDWAKVISRLYQAGELKGLFSEKEFEAILERAEQ